MVTLRKPILPAPLTYGPALPAPAPWAVRSTRLDYCHAAREARQGADRLAAHDEAVADGYGCWDSFCERCTDDGSSAYPFDVDGPSALDWHAFL